MQSARRRKSCSPQPDSWISRDGYWLWHNPARRPADQNGARRCAHPGRCRGLVRQRTGPTLPGAGTDPNLWAGRLTGPDRLEVAGEEIGEPRIFLNVGARPARPDLPGIGDVPTLTSTTLLDLDRVPEHLAVACRSYIGLEFAQMYRRFGAEVTLIERADRRISRDDPEISAATRAILEADGIQVRTGADCDCFAPHAKGATVGVSCAVGAPEAIASDVLVAVSRTPNTNDLGL
ncbi:MAG: FAD-dependent oxidoreductase [Paracoccaceae bacterium]